MLDFVLMLWISWLAVYKSLFFTTNNNTKNIYWDCKGRISSHVNNHLQESLLLDFVIIRIIQFWILKISVFIFFFMTPFHWHKFIYHREMSVRCTWIFLLILQHSDERHVRSNKTWDSRMCCEHMTLISVLWIIPCHEIMILKPGW